MLFHTLCHQDWISAWISDHQPRFIVIKKFFQQFLIQVRTPADFASHHNRKTMLHSKLLARMVLSSSISPVVLHSLLLILFCQRGWCWFSVMSPPDASASNDILESLYKLRIRESDQLKCIRIVRHGNSSEDIGSQLSKVENNGEEEYRSETQIKKLSSQK